MGLLCSDIQVLEQKQKASKEVPKFEFTFTEVPECRTLIVDNIIDGCTLGYLKLHLESASGKGTVESVKQLSKKCAIVTFHNPSSKLIIFYCFIEANCSLYLFMKKKI